MSNWQNLTNIHIQKKLELQADKMVAKYVQERGDSILNEMRVYKLDSLDCVNFKNDSIQFMTIWRQITEGENIVLINSLNLWDKNNTDYDAEKGKIFKMNWDTYDLTYRSMWDGYTYLQFLNDGAEYKVLLGKNLRGNKVREINNFMLQYQNKYKKYYDK